MSSYQVMGDFLQRHAYTNVWCSPAQDKQENLKLARISPINGYWIKFRHLWRTILLPEIKGRYHVYHIGQIHPSILGLFTNDKGAWVSAPYAMNEENLLIDVYNDRGIQVPRGQVYFIVTQDKNLLMAVKISQQEPNKLDIDMETEPLYVRFYSNAYFESARHNQNTELIKCLSARPMTVGEVNTLQAKIAQMSTNQEQMLYFVNGIKVDSVDLVTAQPGDYIDAVFDGSIKRTVTFNVSGLQEFNSTADGIRKYLIHYQGAVDTIEYRDDVDLFLNCKQSNGRNKGVYMNKNDDRMLRMVTHRDYSIPVTRVDGLASANSFLAETSKLQVKLYIRHSGYKRPLVHENNRIKELYKLSDDKVVRAMLGIDSTVSVWTAAALEASEYVRVMGMQFGEISRQAVQKAYGYNAISTLLGYTPKKPRNESGIKLVDIPEGLRGCCTVYEYDANGVLLGYSQSTLDNTHSCQFAGTALVEVVFGLGGTSLDYYDNIRESNVPTNLNYRFYRSTTLGGVPQNDWVDVTGSAEYLGQPGHFKWVSMTNKYNRVISNKKHLAYDLDVGMTAGVYVFNIVHDTLQAGIYRKMDIPMGELDLFLNGHSLIENLDYYVTGHTVTIVNKKFLDSAKEKQRVTVRYTGFCDSELKRYVSDEVGFVYHGVLSHNNRFDLRDDRVMRVTCGGALYAKEELKFAEDGVEVRITDALNGSPYQLRDIVVPMNNYLVADGKLDDSTYTEREKSNVINKEVSDYLTRMLPEKQITQPNAIPARYQVYSPFFARILDDLQTGVLWDDKFYEHFGDEYVRELVTPYLPLLDNDPIGGNREIDTRYVVVHPHSYSTFVTVDMYRWRVLQRIAGVYGNGLIDLSSMIRVQQF